MMRFNKITYLSLEIAKALNTTEAAAFTNGTKYGNMKTLGCYCGNYPSTCWGEAFVRDDQGGRQRQSAAVSASPVTSVRSHLMPPFWLLGPAG